MKNGHEFRPLPFLGNAHLQTVVGALWQGPPLRVAAREQFIQLSDGDQLVAHDSCPPGWRDGTTIAVLVHGLGGSHQSGYMCRLTQLFWRRGIRTFRLDLRGCGRGLRLARHSYNAGCSGDVRTVIETLAAAFPNSPVVLAGFSLGGNIVLKLAGEGSARPLPNLARVGAVNPPIDLELCSQLISHPRNRIYELHFLRDLVALARQRQRHFPHLRTIRFPRKMTLRLFDDLFTAPQGGFADATEYYQKSSSLPFIPSIQVPTLILTARDDPFVAVEPFETLKVPSHIDLRIVPHGGHLGFLGWDGSGGVRWAEQRLAEWLTCIDSVPQYDV